MPLPPVGAVGAAPPPASISSARPSGFGALVEQRAPVQAAGPARAPTPNRALATLEGIERAQRRLDAVLAAARAGRTFTAQELLGLQAEAYRAVQTVDLAAKVVEQGAQSVKQALNAQV
jgi:hypothetical protein